MRCSYCGSHFHTKTNCPKTWQGSINRAKLRCKYCGSHEHDIVACPSTWGGSARRTYNEEQVADHFIKDGDK